MKRAVSNFALQIKLIANSFPYRCTLWRIFRPFLCVKSCKHTFYGHFSRIRKLTQFTHFIWKVFATKILLSGKFSLFLTLIGVRIDYNRMDDDLEEELEAAEYEDFDDAEEESEEEE